jgi:heme A synthase
MRAVFRVLTSVLFVAIVVQVALAAFGSLRAVHDSKATPLSQKSIESGFNAHVALGYVIVLLMLLMLVVAAAGRLEPTKVKLAGALFVLGIVQAILGMVSESVPAIGPLHGINALAIYAVAGLLAHKSWTGDRRGAATSGGATAGA